MNCKSKKRKSMGRKIEKKSFEEKPRMNGNWGERRKGRFGGGPRNRMSGPGPTKVEQDHCLEFQQREITVLSN